MISFDGKVALVTGASRGIGAAIAAQMGKLGAVIAGTATTEEGAAKITQRLAELGIKGAGFVLNVNSPEAVDETLKAVTEKFGDPLILVNNAGITRDNLMLRMKDEEWQTVIDTNLTGVFRVTRACLKGMLKARWGRVVMISSLAGVAGNPGQANYAATKAGVIAFAKSLAIEVASRNITINVVAPGLIETDMAKHLTEDQRQAILTRVPLNRLGQPEEIAAAVSFLASPIAAYITGETINVNGGIYMQ